MLTKEQIENIRLSHQGPSCKDAQARTLLDEYEMLRDSLAKLEGLYECQERLHDSLRAQLAAKDQECERDAVDAQRFRWIAEHDMEIICESCGEFNENRSFREFIDCRMMWHFKPNPAEHGEGK